MYYLCCSCTSERLTVVLAFECPRLRGTRLAGDPGFPAIWAMVHMQEKIKTFYKDDPIKYDMLTSAFDHFAG
jgi:hypothetical protein